jgi:hypothetical protein
MSGTVLPPMSPRGTIQRPSYPGFSRVWPYPFLVDPLGFVSTRPRAPPVNKGTMPARRLQEIARLPQDPGLFTVPSSTSPRHPRDGRPSLGHVATATSTAPIVPSPLRHHPRVFCTPQPPLESIKGEAEGSPNERRKNISSNTPSFFFLETWDRLPLL